MESNGVQTKWSNQGNLLASTVQSEFQDAVGAISQELDGNCWQPSPQQTRNLPCPHAQRLVAQPQRRADLGGRGEHAQKGEGPLLLRPRHPHHHGQHEPPQPWAAHRAPVTGAHVIVIVPPFMNLRSPPAFQRFVNRDIQRLTRLAKGLHDEREQLSTGLQRGPASSIERLVKGAEMRVLLMASVPQSSGYCSAAHWP
jgi:hypothetical protein